MRQVHDKSYYMGVLRVKMNQLTAEIAHLEEIYQKGERDRSDLDAYEQRARKSATELKELQGKLIDYNVLVDRMHMNHEMNEIEAEARREKETADEIEVTVQELFNERQAREIEIEEIATEIDEQKRLNQAILAGMDPSIREHYEGAKEQCEALRAEVEEMEEELNNLNERKDQLEIELGNCPLKKKAIQMRRNLEDLQVKEAALLAEKEAQETPEQKKQKLIEEIKTNNEQISTMEKQIQKLNEMINMVHEEIREFDSGADHKLAKNSEKYRELMIKEREYDEFLEGYEQQKQTLNMELEAFTDDIVRMLQKISANIMKLETNATSNIVGRDELLLLQDNASPTELQNLHVRLQEEMMLLEETETRLKSEIATLERRLGELSEEYASYSDLDKISVEAEKNIEKLEQRRDELESALPEHDAHCERLRERLRELSEKLENNPRYATQKTLLRKLEMLKESNARLRAEVEAREGETNYEPIKAEVRRLREQYNEYLVNTIGRK
ncbi:hypothetical protein Angca_004568 [Angiostrongylus cantonensis]|nr:hypothetical protein Angca_004568 [Angiostrongylus cantonensis]